MHIGCILLLIKRRDNQSSDKFNGTFLKNGQKIIVNIKLLKCQGKCSVGKIYIR